MKYQRQYSMKLAAAKAGMSEKTARKYLRVDLLSSAGKKARIYRTRKDPFEAHWSEIENLLRQSPDLQAKTILYYLIERYPETYSERYLRTLQRRIKASRLDYERDKPVMFLQHIPPGQSSQSDWTVMNNLNVTIAGAAFAHRLFHFMLPYSGWETILICHSESFDTLTQGFEAAVFELGGVLPMHRTDNLSAATKKYGHTRAFTERWQEFLAHYGVKPSRNNPGESHENGSVEKSHDTFKNAVHQHLLLRGSRDFATRESYQDFLHHIKERRNKIRVAKLQAELPYLHALPDRRFADPICFSARVSPSSTIQVLGCTYSVPSRLISYTLAVAVYPDTVAFSYAHKTLLSLPRIRTGTAIDYRHIIDSLVRKPGAFAHYQYRSCLFPHPLFRWAFDELTNVNPTSGHKDYLTLLQLAKRYGESPVLAALLRCQETYQLPESTWVRNQLQPVLLPHVVVQVKAPNVAAYDSLHGFGGASC